MSFFHSERDLKMLVFLLLQLQEGKKKTPWGMCTLWCPLPAISPSNLIQGYLWPTFWITATQVVLFHMFPCWEANGQAEIVRGWIDFSGNSAKSVVQTQVCFPRVPCRAGALGRALLVFILSNLFSQTLTGITGSHLAESMGPASLWNACLSLLMVSSDYGQLAPEGTKVFATLLMFLDTWEVKSQKQTAVPPGKVYRANW